MKNVRPPLISMSGTELGFGLAELAKQLLFYSEHFEDLATSSDVSTLHDAAGYGNGVLPKIRMRLLRYATLVVAKQRPDLPPNYDIEEENNWTINFTEAPASAASATTHARKIWEICRKLIECENKAVETTLVNLDEDLAQHAYLCGELWPKLLERARELETKTS